MVSYGINYIQRFMKMRHLDTKKRTQIQTSNTGCLILRGEFEKGVKF